jgi:hypothetical protein
LRAEARWSSRAVWCALAAGPAARGQVEARAPDAGPRPILCGRDTGRRRLRTSDPEIPSSVTVPMDSPLIPDLAGKRGSRESPFPDSRRNRDREPPRFPIRPGNGNRPGGPLGGEPGSSRCGSPCCHRDCGIGADGESRAAPMSTASSANEHGEQSRRSRHQHGGQLGLARPTRLRDSGHIMNLAQPLRCFVWGTVGCVMPHPERLGRLPFGPAALLLSSVVRSGPWLMYGSTVVPSLQHSGPDRLCVV